MDFKILEPQQDLATWVKCYWNLESPKEKTPKVNTIVPDGCMKLIFHYGDPYMNHTDSGERFVLPRGLLIGQLTKPYIVEPTGETKTFFVCFHPNGFIPFSPFPIKEMENTAVPLDKLFGKDGILLEDNILNASSTEERIEIIEAFLLQKLANHQTIDNIIDSTIETIFTANGQLSVDVISKKNNINRRQLARKFSSDIGLSPKQLSKTIRLQTTLKALLAEKATSLTSVALDNEYYDQAHFIKDFKEFTGLTPKEFYGEHLKMSLIFDT